MNIIVSILSGITSLVFILLIIALFVRKKYGLFREIVIGKPVDEVYNYLKFLKNQDNFSKWALMDPIMKKEYQGIDGTVGFVSAWDSKNKNVGKGEQEIKNLIDGKQIDYEIRFIKPFSGVAQSYLKCETVAENETCIKWGFDSKMKYPMNLMLLFMNMDKMLGNDLETGLKNLKDILEK
ncbi:MAG: SRPBCC family protein [Prolixibacteraceae bacterium]